MILGDSALFSSFPRDWATSFIESFGHSAFGAGVTVTIVETSNVGVKVGMAGRGVMEAIGVVVGIGEGVAVAF